MKNTATFKIDRLPVSENDAVRMTPRGGYKTRKYQEWEEYVGYTVKEVVIETSEWYGVEIIYYFPLYCKNGNIKRKDHKNMDKYAIDTTIKKLVDSNGEKIDDCRIIESSECKVDSKDERVEITYYCIG
jgi:Holliday junction resolvase RusA-like endonuclease